jgi:hypothetical protein
MVFSKLSKASQTSSGSSWQRKHPSLSVVSTAGLCQAGKHAGWRICGSRVVIHFSSLQRDRAQPANSQFWPRFPPQQSLRHPNEANPPLAGVASQLEQGWERSCSFHCSSSMATCYRWKQSEKRTTPGRSPSLILRDRGWSRASRWAFRRLRWGVQPRGTPERKIWSVSRAGQEDGGWAPRGRAAGMGSDPSRASAGSKCRDAFSISSG